MPWLAKFCCHWQLTAMLHRSVCTFNKLGCESSLPHMHLLCMLNLLPFKRQDSQRMSALQHCAKPPTPGPAGTTPGCPQARTWTALPLPRHPCLQTAAVAASAAVGPGRPEAGRPAGRQSWRAGVTPGRPRSEQGPTPAPRSRRVCQQTVARTPARGRACCWSWVCGAASWAQLSRSYQSCLWQC